MRSNSESLCQTPPLAVVTTTHDRRDLLERLLDSLEKQSDADFVWVVVDDASQDATADWLKAVARTSAVAIHVLTNDRQLGKCASLNRVFGNMESPFYLVVDSDDRLLPEGVALVRREMRRCEADKAIGAIFYSYINLEGSPLGGPPDGLSVVATRADFDGRCGKYDGCVGYFRQVVEQYRYPEFDGETYCGPTVLQLKMAPSFSVCFTSIVIGVAEYQRDGLTMRGRALRLANPRGMMEYTRLQREQALSRTATLKYLVMYFAYERLAGIKHVERFPYGTALAATAGGLLARVWSRRYPSNHSQGATR